MPHTYVSVYVHCVFSTKSRRQSIPEELQPRLWAYMGGIARTNRFKAIAIGGVQDHVHILLSLPSTIPVAKAMQLIKAGSSKWMHEVIGKKMFAWQETYGAFSIGVSQVDDTVNYINTQREHHRRRGFDEAFDAILKRHRIVPE